MQDFLLLAFLFLIAGVIAVPIASRLGLGSVLGYLLAGIALSPILAQLNVDVVAIQHFAEFGVVMMLFLVGLELEPSMLWRMRSKLLGLGGLQVGVTLALIAAIAMAFGQPLSVALAIGMVLALSSTAIVLQTLNEKGLMKSDGGQSSFSVLLFQDIAVIPMLAFLPFLAIPELVEAIAAVPTDDHGGGHHGPAFIDTLNAWQRGLVTVGAIAFVVGFGTVLTRPVFRFIAMARLRELFTAFALLMVIGIALLMIVVGLSPALGTFLAGVVLANSEYRHELESNIEPFKGLLLGLFFITVGAAINFDLLASNAAVIIGLSLGLILLKALVLLGLSYVFKIEGADRWLFALGLAQAGEFGFVLLSFTVANGVIPTAVSDQLLLVVAISMLLTPLLFIIYDKLIAPRFAVAQTREPDAIDEQADIIIAGHGRFGGIVNRILRSAGYNTVVLDHHSEQLDRLRMYGIKVFYGDATRPDLLHAAGIEHAKLLVIAIDDREQATELVHYVKANYPHVHITVRAIERHHVFELWEAGARDIIRENFDSAVRTGRSALEALGMHPFEAERHSQAFVRNDKRAMVETAGLYRSDIPAHENEPYVQRARELIAQQEQLYKGDPGPFGNRIDRGWSPPTKKDVEAVTADAEQNETPLGAGSSPTD
ncbi:MAG: cation:proton antiporter [Pseudomonadota bacterium]